MREKLVVSPSVALRVNRANLWIAPLIAGLVLCLGYAVMDRTTQAQEKPPIVEWSLRRLEPICPFCETTVQVKSTKCPKCQQQYLWSEPAFENTPDGALAKFRYALKYKDENKLKESVTQEKLSEVTNWLKETKDKTQEFLNIISIKSEIKDKENEAMVFVLQKIKDSYNPFQIKCIKQGNQWRIIPEIEKMPMEKIRANEISSINCCKLFVMTEAIWRQQDADLNGRQDYWTYDISSFHRMYRADGRTKVALIDLRVAQADAQPANDNAFGKGKIEPWGNNWVPKPKDGYLFKAMTSGEDEGGKVIYKQNEVNGVRATNDFRWAVCAFPAEYGITGVYTYIVNHSGTVYKKDLGPPPEIRTVKKKDRLSPEDEKKVQSLIEQLGVEEWEKREAAQDAIIKIGKVAKELLEKAKDHKDPEVRLRINTILKNEAFSDTLIIHGVVDHWPAMDPTTKGWDPVDGDEEPGWRFRDDEDE